MSLESSEHQRILKDAVGKLVAARYDMAARRKHKAEPDGWSRAMWRAYAELGLLGLRFEERFGGSACGAEETMVVMEAFGRALTLEPYLSTVVLSGGILDRGSSDEQRSRFLPAIAAGECIVALAHSEPAARHDLFAVAATARREGGAWLLNGRKTLVLHGGSADWLIVSARTAGDNRDQHGLGLFLVEASAAGLTRAGYELQDGLRAATVTLDNVRVEAAGIIGDPEGGAALLGRAADDAVAALCAEAVGAMESLHELTLAYLKQRRQFGVAIGSFQALQHAAVDMFIALEMARSMALYAAVMSESDDAEERAGAMSAAKIQIGRSARLIGQTAIQIHGGIGMTMEYAAGHYLKRLTTIDLTFGNVDHHLARMAQGRGLFVPAAG